MFLGVLHPLKKSEESELQKGGAFMAKNKGKSKNCEGKGRKRSGKDFRYGKDNRIGCHDIVSIFQGDSEAFGKVVIKYEPYALACAKGIAADYHGIKNLTGIRGVLLVNLFPILCNTHKINHIILSILIEPVYDMTHLT